MVISVSPSSSLSPTLCYDIRTIVISFGENTTLEEGATTWELYELESGDIIQTQGPLNASELYYLYNIECVDASQYVFNITYTGGRVGNCTLCGYLVYVDDLEVGGAAPFFCSVLVNEMLNFPVPFQRNNMSEPEPCGNDFLVTIGTGDNPKKLAWTLANDEGEILLTGECCYLIYN